MTMMMVMMVVWRMLMLRMLMAPSGQALGIEAAAETEEVGLFLELPRLDLQAPPAPPGRPGPDPDG